MNERRKGERRSWESEPNYPFVDSNGVTVTKNRRRTVDRRSSDEEPQTQLTQLHLSLQERTETISLSNPALLAGRCTPSVLIVERRYVSRRHAQFKYRDGDFFLEDQSTNGTYLQTDEGKKFHLVGEEILLSGSGVISLGRPIINGDESLIQYRCE